VSSLASSVVLLAALASLACSLACAQDEGRHYTVVDCGPSLVRTLTETPGLNNRGDIAIWHSVSANLMPGVVLHGQQTIEITGERDFSFVYPADINDRLVVVGSLQAPQDLRFTHAFKWSDNKLEILHSLGGRYAAATSVNARGEVAGSAQTSSGTRHAVRWQGTQTRDLGLLGQGDYSSARDINDQGDVVGEANLIRNGKPQAFLWHAGKMELLPDLPGASFCSAQALNDRGAIAGSCDLPSGTAHGVIWRNGSVEDLGTLGDKDAPSTALDINDQVEVVGTSEAEGKLVAFLWERGKMIDLNKAIPPKSGWWLLVASRINDKGEILGRGYLGGAIHAFLLQPQQASGKP
jgi:probable HAF family extracellular repeat protein